MIFKKLNAKMKLTFSIIFLLFSFFHDLRSLTLDSPLFPSYCLFIILIYFLSLHIISNF